MLIIFNKIKEVNYMKKLFQLYLPTEKKQNIEEIQVLHYVLAFYSYENYLSKLIMVIHGPF